MNSKRLNALCFTMFIVGIVLLLNLFHDFRCFISCRGGFISNPPTISGGILDDVAYYLEYRFMDVHEIP